MAKIKESSATLTVRKAPRLIPFVATAALIGVIASLILAWSVGASATLFGVVVAYGTLIVTALGLGLALLLDAISTARAKTLKATKLEG